MSPDCTKRNLCPLPRDAHARFSPTAPGLLGVRLTRAPRRTFGRPPRGGEEFDRRPLDRWVAIEFVIFDVVSCWAEGAGKCLGDVQPVRVYRLRGGINWHVYRIARPSRCQSTNLCAAV